MKQKREGWGTLNIGLGRIDENSGTNLSAVDCELTISYVGILKKKYRAKKKKMMSGDQPASSGRKLADAAHGFEQC